MRTDSPPIYIEELLSEFSDHFITKRDYFIPFCGLIQISKRWTLQNLDEKFSGWYEKFNRPGRKKITELVEKAFKKCRSDTDIHILRGLIVESLLIASHGGSKVLNNTQYGWGAAVIINKEAGKSELVKYNCPSANGTTCSDRSTIDFGYWNGNSGKFYECKVQPSGINCKEIKYMKKLQHELLANQISHELYFVCLESIESIKLRLEDEDCSPLFKPMGMRELECLIA